MDFEKIVAPSPRELFVGQIVRMIISGQLKSGEKLPTERELAEKMGINRSLVHNGIEDLQRMGFVRVENRKGNYIKDYAKEGTIHTLEAIAKYSGSDYEPATRISLVETRNAIVGGAMIRLAKIGSTEDFKSLRKMVREQKEEARVDLSNAASYMLNFNLALVKMCGNTIFPLLMNSFAVNVPFWQSCVDHWGVETIFLQEEKMIDLMEAGDGHEAALYMENIHEEFMMDAGLKR